MEICFLIIGDSNCVNKNAICEIDPKNFTNVLNEVHNNLDLYEGQKIKFSGFVYRIYDFSEEQFVLGRNMIISSDFRNCSSWFFM